MYHRYPMNQIITPYIHYFHKDFVSKPRMHHHHMSTISIFAKSYSVVCTSYEIYPFILFTTTSISYIYIISRCIYCGSVTITEAMPYSLCTSKAISFICTSFKEYFSETDLPGSVSIHITYTLFPIEAISGSLDS